jgi:phosphate transport system permease protein
MDIEKQDDEARIEHKVAKTEPINRFLTHPQLKYGKKIYISELLAEKFIQIVAISSILTILAIFWYVFQESIYAFVTEIKRPAPTQMVNTDSNIPSNSNADLKSESYSSEPATATKELKSESYSPEAEELKPQSYSSDNSELKPETYSSSETSNSASEELKPETYGSTATEEVKKDNKNRSKTDKSTIAEVKPEEKTTTVAKNTEDMLASGRETSKSVESSGNNVAISVADLVLSNDKVNGKDDYIWQPISQTPKYSFLPLAMGALKVTLIGLMIAAPIAILAAIFITAFAPRWAKEILKPAIEILAGFPSVVIGFFCLITLATIMQKFFGTEYRLNAFVGGIGMALAVIPIIFTVTEDALSAVPKYMKEASLALGASRWQTVIRVTLPSAIPGVFAAIILGFGRAFGETMIALMATGNAALFSGNIFESVRTMAATIGAEMAEVEFHSVHYGVLFLIGATLFVVTFTLNALAEFWVRKKLLKKFQGN